MDLLQKQYKVPLNSQMFAKSNPKGMAVLLHTLICLFEDQVYRPLFAVCWFPYTLVELKEFKQIALNLCGCLREQGRLGPNVITKAVVETASGVKMWQSLRQMSDWCLLDYMNRNFTKADLKCLPTFVQHTSRSVALDENFDPNISSISSVSSADGNQ